MSNVASRTSKKWGFGFEIHRLHLQLRLGVTTGKNTTSDSKAFPKRLPPEQGNSMAWRAQGHRFFDLCWGDLQCQTLRPEPIKNGDLASRSTVCTFNCVWASRPAKLRLLTQKPSQKGCLRNRETAWPGELKDTVFRPVLG